MTDKYDYIEIWTAKNLLALGYKWIARNISGRMFAHTEKPIKNDTIWDSTGGTLTVCENVVPIFQNIKWEDQEPISLENIVHPQILTESERNYLSAVIRPFRDKIYTISKWSGANGYCEWLKFTGKYEYGAFYLPNFKVGTMYKGMEPKKMYTLEELGL